MSGSNDGYVLHTASSEELVALASDVTVYDTNLFAALAASDDPAVRLAVAGRAKHDDFWKAVRDKYETLWAAGDKISQEALVKLIVRIFEGYPDLAVNYMTNLSNHRELLELFASSDELNGLGWLALSYEASFHDFYAPGMYDRILDILSGRADRVSVEDLNFTLDARPIFKLSDNALEMLVSYPGVSEEILDWLATNIDSFRTGVLDSKNTRFFTESRQSLILSGLLDDPAGNAHIIEMIISDHNVPSSMIVECLSGKKERVLNNISAVLQLGYLDVMVGRLAPEIGLVWGAMPDGWLRNLVALFVRNAEEVYG